MIYATLKQNPSGTNAAPTKNVLVKKKGIKPPFRHEPGSRKLKDRVQCKMCDKSFAYAWDLTRHMRKHTGHFKFWCGECQKDFQDKTSYTAHMNKHEGITFPCNRCNKRFRHQISLKYHLSEHTGVYQYRCGKCGRGFNIRPEFRKHEETCGK